MYIYINRIKCWQYLYIINTFFIHKIIHSYMLSGRWLLIRKMELTNCVPIMVDADVYSFITNTQKKHQSTARSTPATLSWHAKRVDWEGNSWVNWSPTSNSLAQAVVKKKKELLLTCAIMTGFTQFF